MNMIATGLILSCITTGIIWKIMPKNNDDEENNNNNNIIYPKGPSFEELNNGNYMKYKVIRKASKEYVINL
jgi:hypothetical protein